MPVDESGIVYRIKLVGECITEETVNVFHYASGFYEGSVNDLMGAFDTQVAAVIQTLLSVDMLLTGIEAQQERGGSNFGSMSINRGGVQGGDCLPPFVAFDFTLVRGGALERNGYKRIPGVPEALNAQGLITGPGRAVADTLAAAMAADLTIGLDHFHPVIRRGHINHIPQNPAKYYTISGVQYSKLGSQNSRKFGHGR